MAKRILVIEYDPKTRAALRALLIQSGYEVVGETDDGKEGIKLYKSLKPDLVTIDITSPDLDGDSVQSEILTADPQAKIVLTADRGNSKLITAAIMAGAKDYLIRPFQPQLVSETMREVLSD